jgi:hypothetical protein
MKEIIPTEKLKSGSAVELDASLFEPVGEWKKEKRKVEIVVKCGKDKSFDLDDFLSLLPASPKELYHLVKNAFDQYYGDQWCGQDGVDDVIHAFDGNLDRYKPDPREKFKNEGLAPFFEINRIEVDLDAGRVIISGGADEDVNLEEHGVNILIQDGEVVFGYALDHEAAAFDWDANFMKIAFPQVDCGITPFVGIWDFGMGDTLEITEGAILFHSAWKKDQDPAILVMKMCSSNHLYLKFEDEAQEMVLKLDGNQLVSLNYDGTKLASLRSKAKK